MQLIASRMKAPATNGGMNETQGFLSSARGGGGADDIAGGGYDEAYVAWYCGTECG